MDPVWPLYFELPNKSNVGALGIITLSIMAALSPCGYYAISVSIPIGWSFGLHKNRLMFSVVMNLCK